MSLPDDVAARLERERNASAYVAEAVRERIVREQTMELLAAHGFEVTEEGKARARAELDEARQRVSAERFAELRRSLRPSA